MFEINKRIREKMGAQKMTITDLANKAGLARSTVSRYVSDSIEPKQNAVGAIAKALNVSVSWLLFGEDGETLTEIDPRKLTEGNRARLLAYYQALLDSQEDVHGDT